MKKAVLIIDMPDSCLECPVCASYAESAFSKREYWCCVNNKDVDPDRRANWCPLKIAKVVDTNSNPLIVDDLV